MIRYYLLLILGLTALDQAIKVWVRTHLRPTDFIEVIPNLIHLTYQENRGISFSLFADLPDVYRAPLLAGISLIVIVIMGWYLINSFSEMGRLDRWGYSLILAGALGNLIDRALRHSVTDYMYFHYYDRGFFVNNLADDLISIGFVLLVIHGLLGNRDEEG